MRRPAALALALALALAGCTRSTAYVDPVPPNREPVTGARCPATTGTARSALPNVTLACLGPGQPVHLAAVRGPALVNVWASWCAPCIDEMPRLERLHTSAGGRLLVLGVVTDDRAAPARALVAKLGVTYPSLLDADGTVRRHLGVPGPPITLLVDGRGRVVRRIVGGVPALPELRRLVADALGVSA